MGRMGSYKIRVDHLLQEPETPWVLIRLLHTRLENLWVLIKSTQSVNDRNQGSHETRGYHGSHMQPRGPVDSDANPPKQEPGDSISYHKSRAARQRQEPGEPGDFCPQRFLLDPYSPSITGTRESTGSHSTRALPP